MYKRQRQDNADFRLTQKGFDLGIASQERLDLMNQKLAEVIKIKKVLQDYSVEPEMINSFLAEKNSATLNEKSKAYKILLRPNINIQELVEQIPILKAEIGGLNPLSL